VGKTTSTRRGPSAKGPRNLQPGEVVRIDSKVGATDAEGRAVDFRNDHAIVTTSNPHHTVDGVPCVAVTTEDGSFISVPRAAIRRV
jgi:hypothetical protein